MDDNLPTDGAENARRAREKANSRPERRTRKIDPQDRSIDLSKESKEAALEKATEKRPGAGP